jgi:hypothetical protein
MTTPALSHFVEFRSISIMKIKVLQIQFESVVNST